MGPVAFDHFRIAPQVLDNFGNESVLFIVGSFLPGLIAPVGDQFFQAAQDGFILIAQSFFLG